MQYTFQYHANGNLLLTGEFLVAQGAQAIVVLLKKKANTGCETR